MIPLSILFLRGWDNLDATVYSTFSKEVQFSNQKNWVSEHFSSSY